MPRTALEEVAPPRAAVSAVPATPPAVSPEPPVGTEPSLIEALAGPPQKKRSGSRPREDEPPEPPAAGGCVSVADETVRLRAMQRSLELGQANAALAAADGYQRQCRARHLEAEVAAARVLALCAAGRSEQARESAASFASRWPASPLLPRVRSSCAGDAEPEGDKP